MTSEASAWLAREMYSEGGGKRCIYIYICSEYIRFPPRMGMENTSLPRSRFLCIENLIVCQVDGGVSRKLMQRTHGGIASPVDSIFSP